MTTHAMPAELAEILEEIIPPSGEPAGARGGHRDTPSGPGGALRHRQHIHLAFIAVRRYGTTQAVDKTSAWIRHLTAHAPQKYNATVTRAWTEIVGHHVAADASVTDFEVFAEQNPALLDKRLLTRHYTAATLASPQARADWAEPDVADFPWSSRP
jgi:hypothetical protein